jgi:hypothetical protein
VDGQAVLAAVAACVRGGMVGPEIDMAGALAMARSDDVDPAIAAPLIAAAMAGIRAGVASRKGDE